MFNGYAPPLAVRAVTAAEMACDGELPEIVLAEQVKRRVNQAADAARAGVAVGGSYHAAHLLCAAAQACSGQPMTAALRASQFCAWAAADEPPWSGRPSGVSAEYAAERAIQADLLRDIFGNPFRSSELRPEWLTDTVANLARQMYASREFGAMPILADALQDAGCDDEDMLSHCRGDREHVRGCWVVDLLLGKQ